MRVEGQTRNSQAIQKQTQADILKTEPQQLTGECGPCVSLCLPSLNPRAAHLDQGTG